MKRALFMMLMAGLVSWMSSGAIVAGNGADAGVVIPGTVEKGAITVCSSGCDYTSIRSAIDAANPGDTIALGPETFEGGIFINKPLTIKGAGAQHTIIEGGRRGLGTSRESGRVRLLDMTIQNATHAGGVYGTDLEIERCVIQGNHAKGEYSVGGVEIWGGLIRDSVIRNNSAEGCIRWPDEFCPSFAGGILAGNTTTVEGTVIDNNQGDLVGGLFVFFGEAVITRTMIEGNEGDWAGGGLTWYSGDVVVESGTIRRNTGDVAGGFSGATTMKSLEISENTGQCAASAATIRESTIADNEGHGLCLEAHATVLNSTVSGNQGDGIRALGSAYRTAEFRIDSSTITGNLGVGVVAQSPANGSIHNSIVANNGMFQCEFEGDEIASQGHNLSSDLSCPFWEYGDMESTDPMLLPLARYGGPTRTHLPDPGSPVVDAGGDECPSIDQRGRSRPLDGDLDGDPVCDIGAHEAGPYDIEPAGQGTGGTIVLPTRRE